MKDLAQCVQEVLAEVGRLLISQLHGRDDLARAIFNALYPQFKRYPYHKVLTHTVLQYVEQKDESKEDVIARLQGKSPLPNLPGASKIRPTNRPEYERKDWNEYSAAMRTIAAAFGITVDCYQKYNRLAVNFRYRELNRERRDALSALSVVENLVELVSEFPAGYLMTLEPPNGAHVAPNDAHERKDWKEYSAAMRTIAEAFGTTVDCRKKFKRLAVDFRYEKLSIEQRDALLVVDELVQLVSEFPEGYLVTLEPPNE